MTETGNQSDPERVADKCHDNRYCFSRTLCSQGSRGTFNDDYIRMEPENRMDACLYVLIATVSIPPINHYIFALDVPGLPKASTECHCLFTLLADAYRNNADASWPCLLTICSGEGGHKEDEA